LEEVDVVEVVEVEVGRARGRGERERGKRAYASACKYVCPWSVCVNGVPIVP
jgi:hypothetical protein